MKRTMVICVVLALAIAGSASANYLWQAAATSSANQYAGTALQFGYQSALATTGQDWSTAQAAYCAVATLAAGPAGAKTALNKIDKWTGVDRAPVYMAVWADNGYGGGATIDVRLWLGTSNTTNAKVAQKYQVKVVFDPNGVLTGQTLQNSLNLADPLVPLTTGGNQAAPKWKANIPVAKTALPLDAGTTYILELSVPEPGSIVAMLTGLVGLVGFGIRRRR